MKPSHRFYKSLREKIGTRQEVSKLLGVHLRTLERRENGEVEITDEMVAALKWILNNPEPIKLMSIKKAIKCGAGLVKKIKTIPREFIRGSVTLDDSIPKAKFMKLSDSIKISENVKWALNK